ncbi:hypothetical protein C7446_1973 [Kushneria sinocarnis]|uniref:Uncharacterized protein n=1 Tax=Kushneria sinocarnis TaxID=595502 RepID=A0A420WWE1_9GAMM|nr:hypothetical protein [Kushneria sinocarnis]RKR03448.1 hypothetical protein C7446_1973 [Kushneria sinocarnis]
MSHITRTNTLAAVILAAALPTAALANPLDAGQGESAAMAAHFDRQSQTVSVEDSTPSGPFAAEPANLQPGQGQSAAMAATYRHNTQPLNLGHAAVADQNGDYRHSRGRDIRHIARFGSGESPAMAETYRHISEPLRVDDGSLVYRHADRPAASSEADA